jgi:hypothetical protein
MLLDTIKRTTIGALIKEPLIANAITTASVSSKMELAAQISAALFLPPGALKTDTPKSQPGRIQKKVATDSAKPKRGPSTLAVTASNTVPNISKEDNLPARNCFEVLNGIRHT